MKYMQFRDYDADDENYNHRDGKRDKQKPWKNDQQRKLRGRYEETNYRSDEDED